MKDKLLPNLATDFVEEKIIFPTIAEPKIDGVRGIYLHHGLTGRSLKKHDNIYTTKLYSNPILKGLDGEMYVESTTASFLVNKTSSALSKIEGEPLVYWKVFDYITEVTRYLPYIERLKLLIKQVNLINSIDELPFKDLISVTDYKIINDLDSLLAYEAEILEQGYEGVCIRDPNGIYKSGRSTVKEGGLLRIKRFVQEDAIVIGLLEAVENKNESKKNELGLSERSSHKENLIPKGMVGTLICRDIKTGKIIEVGPGRLTHKQRIKYWLNKDLILNKLISYKHFPFGVKNKPRFPTFYDFRINSDKVNI